jgi:hypothetical protein
MPSDISQQFVHHLWRVTFLFVIPAGVVGLLAGVFVKRFENWIVRKIRNWKQSGDSARKP